MPIFRASVDPDELIANADPAELEPYKTVYDEERGGHFPQETTDER